VGSRCFVYDNLAFRAELLVPDQDSNLEQTG
jgi:hypothetical protein